MRFCQIDQITQLVPGKLIQAQSRVTGKEDYLRDHFPRFAVMPGVLMLEALFQASAFLVRASDGYRSGLVLLRTAKNVKFADFVQPGETLHITAEILRQDTNQYLLKASGFKGEKTAVSGRLVVECVTGSEDSLADRHASQFMRQKTEQLCQASMASAPDSYNLRPLKSISS